MRKFNMCAKRIFDITGSFIVLLVLSPILLLSALLIVCFMPGPIFFFQERVGKDGKTFKIYKFRTMKVDKEAEENFDVSKDKERRTAVGDFLRRFKIDEVVQLINVLKGDMSMVGPRPTFKRHTDNYNDFEKQRLNMRPGMTGLAQVNGNVSLAWDERIIYDVQYVNNFSLLLDIKILFKTVLIVLFGEKRFKRSPIKNEKEIIHNYEEAIK
ncbi:MAG: sugar transferase [Oscillospiraceae bacterium]|nr:sugar transferase [Oscillospiraceae bacterium]